MSNNITLAKNTFFLFFRMIVVMGVSLYTSRIVLRELGTSDFGLYNVVGGVVTMFAFVSNNMMSSIQRFLNYEMGRNDVERLKLLFQTSRWTQIMMGLVLLLMVEVVGLWFLNNKLNIPDGRVGAAHVLFHLSALSFVVSVFNIPYRAAILANEKMKIFAMISFVEAMGKLLIVYCLYLTSNDKLILYGALVLLVTIIVNIIYRRYAVSNFIECRSRKFSFDTSYFREIFSFSGFSIISSFSIMLRTQGITFLLNIFFGTVVNAAQGIANQVNTTVSNFVGNFTQSVNPQLVKEYAKGNLVELNKLVLFSSRISIFLLLIVSMPLYIEADAVLSFWLSEVPPDTAEFVRLVLIISVIQACGSVHGTAQGATGKIKLYHITLSAVALLTLPLAYFLVTHGFPSFSVYWASIVTTFMVAVLRLFFLRKSIGLSLRRFFVNVGFRSFMVIVIPYFLTIFFKDSLVGGASSAFFVMLINIALVSICIVMFGLERSERNKICAILSDKLRLKK